jgi:hypothetical protein
MNQRKPEFRVLNFFASYDEGRDESLPLDEALKRETKGYVSLYCCISGITQRGTTASSELRYRLINWLQKPPTYKLLEPRPLGQEQQPQAGELYLYGANIVSDYPAKNREFLDKLRNILSEEENPFQSSASYALNQAIIYDVLGDSSEHSRLINETLGYKEYLLWDDGGLWGQDAWDSAREQLCQQSFTEEQAEQRLAWTGAGWMSLQFEHECERQKKPCPIPPSLASWASSALENLKK